MLQLFFIKESCSQWVRTEENTILEIMGGSSPVETHVRSRSLDLDPQAVKDIRAQTQIVVIILVPAPVRDMGADTTTLRPVPAPVISTVDTAMDPRSEVESTAQVYIYQTLLASAHGKQLRYSHFGEGIGAIDDSHYNQRSNVNMTSLLYTRGLKYVMVRNPLLNFNQHWRERYPARSKLQKLTI